MANVAVDVELVISVDISFSMSSDEYDLVLTGLEDAFRNTTVQTSLLNAGNRGKVAIKVIYWAVNQVDKIDWTLIESIQDAEDFADTISSLTRNSTEDIGSETALGDSLDYAGGLFGDGFDGDRKIIDVTGDGVTNFGSLSTLNGRASALSQGTDTINGLPIGPSAVVEAHYEFEVVGGDNGFHVHAEDYEDFGDAFLQKLSQELSIEDVVANAACVNLAASSFTGLDHLEGETVAILADGKVLAQQVVTNGQITLSDEYGVVHVGLPYYSDIETVDIELLSDVDTLQGRRIKVGNLSMGFVDSKGGYLGYNQDNLYEAFTTLMVTRNNTELDFNETFVASTASSLLYTGKIRVPLKGKYNKGGRMFFRQQDPTPVTISQIIPEISIGGS